MSSPGTPLRPTRSSGRRGGLLLLVVLLTSTISANATTCRSNPSRSAYSQYRVVDGRKCWYSGHARKDKRELRWTVARHYIPIRRKPAPSPIQPDVWPPPPTEFDHRFLGEDQEPPAVFDQRFMGK